MEKKIEATRDKKRDAKEEVISDVVGPRRRRARKERREAGRELRKLKRKKNRVETIQKRHERRDKAGRDTERIEKRADRVLSKVDLSDVNSETAPTQAATSPGTEWEANQFQEDFLDTPTASAPLEPEKAAQFSQVKNALDAVNESNYPSEAKGHPLRSLLEAMAVGLQSRKGSAFEIKPSATQDDVQEIWDNSKPPVMLGGIGSDGHFLAQNKEGLWIKDETLEAAEKGEASKESMEDYFHTQRVMLIARWLPHANRDELAGYLPELLPKAKDKKIEKLADKEGKDMDRLIKNMSKNPHDYPPMAVRKVVKYIIEKAPAQKAEHNERLSTITSRLDGLVRAKNWNKIRQITLILDPTMKPRDLRDEDFVKKDVVDWLKKDLIEDAAFFGYQQGKEALAALDSNIPFELPEPEEAGSGRKGRRKSAILSDIDSL